MSYHPAGYMPIKTGSIYLDCIPKDGGSDVFGPYFTVRFTHQGVMADNDIILLQRHEAERCWYSEYKMTKYTSINIRVTV